MSEQKLLLSIKDAMNFVRVSLSSMKKSELKRLASLLTDKFSELEKDFKFFQWFLACLDMIDCRLLKEKPSPKKKSAPSNPCHIVFEKKAIEMINLQRILKSSKVTEAIP